MKSEKTTETYRHSTRVAIVSLPSPFRVVKTAPTKNVTYHFITISPKRTATTSTSTTTSTTTTTTTETPSRTYKYDLQRNSNVVEDFKYENIHPTTYSPPRNYIKHKATLKPIALTTYIANATNLKSIRKLINPIDINYVLSSLSNDNAKDTRAEITTRLPTTMKPTTKITTVTRSLIAEINGELKSDNDVKEFVESTPRRTFQATVERAPVHELLDLEDLPKAEPDLPPTYKVKPNPVPTKQSSDISRNSSYPSRASRVNSAIKSLIAVGGSRRHNTKCADTQTPDVKCDDIKQRYLFLLESDKNK